jgi:hypothetical protein
MERIETSLTDCITDFAAIVRVRRDIDDLLDASCNVRLLHDCSERALGSNTAFLGRVAAKLSVLVYERGRNKPLLLGLFEHFDQNAAITLARPARGRLSTAPHER